MISVLILTRNEALDLPGALASVAFSRRHPHPRLPLHRRHPGHRPRRRRPPPPAAPSTTYATQRNFGLALPFQTPLAPHPRRRRAPHPPPFAARCSKARATPTPRPTSPPTASAAATSSSEPGSSTPSSAPFTSASSAPARARYTRAINEVLEIEGAIADLSEPLDHFPFSKGIAHWLSKHNRYSTLEARLIHAQQGLQNPSLKTALTHPDFHTRRLHQKAIFYRLPGRPLLKWCYMMFVRGALLDGSAGITYATLQSIYEYLIVLKTKELQQRESGNF